MTCILADNTDTVPLGSLLRHVLPTVERLPYELGLEILRTAYIDFCKRTSMLIYEQSIDLQRGVSDYELTPPAGYEVYQVLGRDANDTLRWSSPDYWGPIAGNRYTITGNKWVNFQMAPPRDWMGGELIRYIVIPDSCIDVIPTEIATSYGPGIAYGALEIVLLYKNRQWYDPNLSMLFGRKFNIQIGSAKNLAMTNRQPNNNRIAVHSFVGRRR